MKYKGKLDLVPIAQKCLLSLEEAITYTGLGKHTLLELSEKDELSLFIWTAGNAYLSAKNWKSLSKTLTWHKGNGRIIMDYDRKLELVPIWHKSTLSLEEATAYSGIGRHKLAELSDDPNCEFILWVGRKRLFKRKKLDEYIERSFSV